MKNLEIVTKYREILWLYSGYQYQLTGSGKTCSDIDLNMIVDEGECKTALEDLGQTFIGNHSWSWYPSGCISIKDSVGYFNKHESGTGNANAKSVCKQGVYQFIHNQYLSKTYNLQTQQTPLEFSIQWNFSLSSIFRIM